MKVMNTLKTMLMVSLIGISSAHAEVSCPTTDDLQSMGFLSAEVKDFSPQTQEMRLKTYFGQHHKHAAWLLEINHLFVSQSQDIEAVAKTVLSQLQMVSDHSFIDKPSLLGFKVPVCVYTVEGSKVQGFLYLLNETPNLNLKQALSKQKV